uniref:Putative secreted protein n=1 Tax=Ixodes ricinus TaxID=34613 RepID=A0A6B0URF0_IXORI
MRKRADVVFALTVSRYVLPLCMCTVLWVLCRSHFDSVCVCCAVDVSKPFWTLCAHVYSDVDVPESSCTSFAHVYGVVSVMPEPFWTLCVCAVDVPKPFWSCVSVYSAVVVVPERASLDSVCVRRKGVLMFWV